MGDQGVQWLYQCLHGTLQPDTATRLAAEAALTAAALQPGFGAALVQVCVGWGVCGVFVGWCGRGECGRYCFLGVEVHRQGKSTMLSWRPAPSFRTKSSTLADP
jgi:hypothetical protein